MFSSSDKHGFFLGAGPSSPFPTNSSNYINEFFPFLDDKALPSIFPDVGIGYHFSKTDLVTAISFRPMQQNRKAYGFDQTIKRKSIIIETYKFLTDYHGFAPYVGLGFSYENLKLIEFDNLIKRADITENKISAALVFGWDIRPSKKGDWWILRTNLRYTPFLNIEHQTKKLSLQHIEFNFIQFVFYPHRFKRSKTLN